MPRPLIARLADLKTEIEGHTWGDHSGEPEEWIWSLIFENAMRDSGTRISPVTPAVWMPVEPGFRPFHNGPGIQRP